MTKSIARFRKGNILAALRRSPLVVSDLDLTWPVPMRTSRSVPNLATIHQVGYAIVATASAVSSLNSAAVEELLRALPASFRLMRSRWAGGASL